MAAQRRTSRIASLIAVAAFGAVGCKTTGQAVGKAAAATSVATTSSTVLASTAESTSDLVRWLWPFQTEHGPNEQIAQMREQAGPAHFQNEELLAGRDEMHGRNTDFAAHRAKFISPAFASSRTRFRTGTTRPQAGPVLGPLAGQAAAEAALVARASGGVALTPVQPVLAALLPGFGN